MQSFVNEGLVGRGFEQRHYAPLKQRPLSVAQPRMTGLFLVCSNFNRQVYLRVISTIATPAMTWYVVLLSTHLKPTIRGLSPARTNVWKVMLYILYAAQVSTPGRTP